MKLILQRPRLFMAIAGIVTFVTAFTVGFNVAPTTAHDGESAMAASVDGNATAGSAVAAEPDPLLLPTPAPEVFTVRTEGSALLVFNMYGEVELHESIPPYLLDDELAELSSGITIIGREAMLRFLEDFTE